MSMEINGGYGRTAADYGEQRNNGLRPEEAGRAKNLQKAEEQKRSARFAEPRDEYISSEKSGKKPTGLYRVEQDENGNRKIYFDDPNKAPRTEGKEVPKAEADAVKAEGNSSAKTDGRASKAEGKDPEKPEICVGNTDRVEREIRKLKEKKQQLEQQLQSASGDEKKVKELERKLAQVEQEISEKDNDSYRRQHTVFT